MAQKLKAFVALTEDQGLDHSTHIVAYNHPLFKFHGIWWVLENSMSTRHAHGVHIHMQTQYSMGPRFDSQNAHIS